MLYTATAAFLNTATDQFQTEIKGYNSIHFTEKRLRCSLRISKKRPHEGSDKDTQHHMRLDRVAAVCCRFQFLCSLTGTIITTCRSFVPVIEQAAVKLEFKEDVLQPLMTGNDKPHRNNVVLSY